MIRKKSRILVVDDSVLLRKIIGDIVGADDKFSLAGTAKDGIDALKQVKSLKPDVVTMDIQMPRMSGLEALEKIMDECPVPVVMVSSLTSRAASVTFDALNLGAVDYVTKPEKATDLGDSFRKNFLEKLRLASVIDLGKMQKLRHRRRPAPASVTNQIEDKPSLEQACVVIGISTGGPPALSSIFESLTPPLPPILVVQHMPSHFTGPFAARLNSISALSVKEGSSGDVLQPNCAFIAPGGKHMEVRKAGSKVTIRIRDGEPVSGHKPSVDVTMTTAANIFGKRCAGVIMTGMGHDGVEGCAAIREVGGNVAGQDEATSAVYGMNKIAFERGHVKKQFSLEDAPATITRLAKGCSEASRARASAIC